MMKWREIEQAGIKALRACLREAPFLRVKRLPVSTREDRPDTMLKVSWGQGEQVIIGEVKGSGEPRLVRMALEALRRYRGARKNAYGVFIAPYVSEQSAALCMEEGVGYVDLAGNCRLCFGRVFILKQGAKNRLSVRRNLRSLYSPKAARALRVLLAAPRRFWKVQELAEEAEISLGQASNVKKLLADREWIRSEPVGFSVSEPEALLVEWAENQANRRDRANDFYTLKPVADVERDLASACAAREIRYALTSFSAAMRFAPMVRNQRLTAYVSDLPAALVSEQGLKRVDSGANVTLIVPADEGVFYGARPVGGVMTVSPVQAYLDLRRIPGRGDEAAEALLKTVLRPQW